MTTTDMKYKLNRLTKTMSRTIKNWKSRGGQPALPDVAESIRSWKNDMDILSYHDEVNGPSFQSARSKMDDAWENRDDRDGAISAMEGALGSLEDIPKELESPQYTKSYHSRNIKSLWGDELARYDHDPHVFSELYEIKRQIDGFRATASPEYVDDINLRRVKSELQDVTDRYEHGTDLSQLGNSAVKSLTLANGSRRQPVQMRQHFDRALKALDNMGVQADLYHSPTGYKATLEDGAGEASYAVERMQDLMYTQPFYSPSEFMVKASLLADDIIDSIAPFYDPKATRMAGSIKSLIQDAKATASNPRVKSMGHDAWQYSGVASPFNEAINRLDDLSVHIENL